VIDTSAYPVREAKPASRIVYFDTKSKILRQVQAAAAGAAAAGATAAKIGDRLFPGFHVHALLQSQAIAVFHRA
jgi:hypothetical protein